MMRKLASGEPIIIEQPRVITNEGAWITRPVRSGVFVQYSDKPYTYDECVVRYTNNEHTVKCNIQRVVPVFKYAWLWRMHKVRNTLTLKWWLVRQGRQFVQ